MKISPPPRSTRTDTPFPYQTPFRSPGVVEPAEADAGPAPPGRLQQVRHARAPRALPVPLLPVADEEALVRAQPQALHDPQQPFRVGLQPVDVGIDGRYRSEEHTSELQSLMRISYAVFCLQKKTHHTCEKENRR